VGQGGRAELGARDRSLEDYRAGSGIADLAHKATIIIVISIIIIVSQ